MYSHYNVYFSDPNNDTEALNLEIELNAHSWFKDSGKKCSRQILALRGGR